MMRVPAASRLYLVSRSFALTGGQVATVLLTLLVVLTLHGSAAQVAGILIVRQGIGLVLRYPLALWIDTRGDQIGLQATAQLGAGAAVAIVPCLSWGGLLTYPTLLAAAALFFTCETVVMTSGYGIVNTLVPPGSRVEYTGKLSSVSSVSGVVGQSTGPTLLRFVPAPVALLAGAALSVAGAVLVRFVVPDAKSVPDTPDPGSSPGTQNSDEHERRVSVGDDAGTRPPAAWRRHTTQLFGTVRVVSTQRYVVLPWMLAFGAAIMEPVFVLYVLHGLGVAEELLGILLAFGAVGSIAGGLLTGRLEKRLGTAPLIALCAAASAAAVPVLMLGDRVAVLTYPGVALCEAISAFASTIAVSVAFGRLAEDTGPDRISQTMSVARTGLDVVLIAGLVAGAQLGDHVGLRAALAAAAGWFILACATSLLTARHGPLPPAADAPDAPEAPGAHEAVRAAATTGPQTP